MLETDVCISARLSYWKDTELSFPCNCGSSLDPSNEQKVVLEKYSQATFENTHLNANQGLSHEQPMGSLQNILSKIALAMPSKKKKRANCYPISRSEFVPSPPIHSMLQNMFCHLKSQHTLNCDELGFG